MTANATLTFSDVSKSFSWTRVLEDINLTVTEGEYVALMGPNGAGKTTLLRMAAGLGAPTSGAVTLAGVDLRKAGPGLRRMLGFVSHESLLYPDLTGRENLEFHAHLFGVADPARVIAVQSELLDLDPILDRPAGVLSRGNRQRLTLARSLLYGPKVLLMDEPFTGLDEVSTGRLLSILDEMVAAGRTVIMTTHDRLIAQSGPQRLVMLGGGNIVRDEPIIHASVPASLILHATKESVTLTTSTVTEELELNAPTVKAMVEARTGTLPSVDSLEELMTELNTPTDPAEFTSPVMVTPPGRFRSAWAIAKKDLRVELRTKDALGASGLFALAVLITASFTMPQGDTRTGMATGVLWISILFAVLLSVGRTMAKESADRGIEGLLLSPVPRESVFIGKAISNLALVLMVDIVIIPLFLVMMTNDGTGANLLALTGTVLLGSIGLVAVATLFSGIAVGSRLGESMLPLLVMPVVIPLMVGSVELTRQALGAGDAGSAVGQWLAIMAAFDLMVIFVAMATFTYVIEE